MKALRLIVVILFFAIIIAPIAAFNFQEDAISLIDNRNLTANPFTSDGDFTNNIQNYVNDRIGFRDDMILAYTVLNDKLFKKMVHPSYIYGTDGYVFGAGLTVNNPYTEFHETYADMVKQIQDYCDSRGVPFLFVFNPAKPAVLTEYLPKGMNYDRTWVDLFFSALDERHVRYIDNTLLLQEKTRLGETVFNQKYDANHWNDLGAYYGTYAMLQELQKRIPEIHLTEKNEMTISETLMTSLPVSEFPIHEMVPSISIDMNLDFTNSSLYGEQLELHPSFRSFGYYMNKERIESGAPKALVFQGSYMNGFGYKYLANAFGEYIYVHDYQNVIDFSYYFNIFQPDCVIFEVAEYTFTNNYFDYEAMKAMKLNPTLQSIESEPIVEQETLLDSESILVDKGDILTKILWRCSESPEYVWFVQDIAYDMKKTEEGYEVTLTTEAYENCDEVFKIVTWDGNNCTRYVH